MSESCPNMQPDTAQMELDQIALQTRMDRIGKKLLVLTGEDMNLRGWLREFAKEYDLYLLSIPKGDTATFEESTVFRVEIRNLHPLDRELVEGSKKKKKKKRK